MLLFHAQVLTSHLSPFHRKRLTLTLLIIEKHGNGSFKIYQSPVQFTCCSHGVFAMQQQMLNCIRLIQIPRSN